MEAWFNDRFFTRSSSAEGTTHNYKLPDSNVIVNKDGLSIGFNSVVKFTNNPINQSLVKLENSITLLTKEPKPFEYFIDIVH